MKSQPVKITLISPAGKREPALANVQGGISALFTYLPQAIVHWTPEMFSDAEPYHAHTDDERLANLVYALRSDADVIWCIGGGYGCTRLLPKLQKITPPAQEKLFIGFSDITALHLFFSQQWGWRTAHGIVFRQLNLLAKRQLSRLSASKVCKLIENKQHSASIPHITPLNKAAEGTTITAKVTGGNLSIIQTLIGTPWAMDGRDKIICLEDVAEAGYRVDRMLNHLWQAGSFAGAKAIIFGDFSQDVAKPADVAYALRRFAAVCPLPVFQSKYFGHGKYNYPFIYNRQARLDFISDDKNGKLIFMNYLN